MLAVLILLVLSAAVAFSAGEENVAYFDNLACNFNGDFCGNTVCTLTPHNDKQTEQTSTLSCKLTKPIDDIRLRVTIFAKELQANLVDIDEDFCGFMSGKVPSKVLGVVMPFVKKYSNINHICPYNGEITVKDLPLGSHLLAAHEVPSGDYILMTAIIANGVLLSNTSSLLHIPEGKMVNGK